MKVTVAEFVSCWLRKSGKTQVEIAREVGLRNPNFLSMINKGKARIPMNRIPALAKALQVCPRDLFFRCLEEYEPELLETIHSILPGAFLSDEQLETLDLFREEILAMVGPRRSTRRSGLKT
jgi:hypothetical protein